MRPTYFLSNHSDWGFIQELVPFTLKSCPPTPPHPPVKHLWKHSPYSKCLTNARGNLQFNQTDKFIHHSQERSKRSIVTVLQMWEKWFLTLHWIYLGAVMHVYLSAHIVRIKLVHHGKEFSILWLRLWQFVHPRPHWFMSGSAQPSSEQSKLDLLCLTGRCHASPGKLVRRSLGSGWPVVTNNRSLLSQESLRPRIKGMSYILFYMSLSPLSLGVGYVTNYQGKVRSLPVVISSPSYAREMLEASNSQDWVCFS